MPWLADSDVRAAEGFIRALTGARTPAGLRRRALVGLAQLVPADVMTWDRVELVTGAVRHEAVPAEAEPPGAFAAVVGDAAGHPLLAAHAARRRAALRLSEAVEPRGLSHTELFADLLRPSGFGYGIAIGVRTERREVVVAGLGRAEREFSERDRDSSVAALPTSIRLHHKPRGGGLMYVRVVRFTGVTPERMEEVRARVEESGGPPPGVSATGLRVLLDESQGTAVVLQEFASAEDMQEGDKVFSAMDPGETPGTRASVDMCEVAFEERM